MAEKSTKKKTTKKKTEEVAPVEAAEEVTEKTTEEAPAKEEVKVEAPKSVSKPVATKPLSDEHKHMLLSTCDYVVTEALAQQAQGNFTPDQKELVKKHLADWELIKSRCEAVV